MPLDATVGTASANSYLSVAAADLLAQSDLGRAPKDWLAATDDEKEAALTRATEEIDAHLSRVAYAYAPTQALLFPRAEDVVSSAAVIPLRIQRATYRQAVYLIRNASLIDDAASRRARGMLNFSNPDGTGGQVSTDGSFGRLDPTVERTLVQYEGGTVAAVIETT